MIRRETPRDRESIRKVNTLAFGQENEADLVDAIRASDHFIKALSLVAERAGEVVGHILFSRITIETDQGEIGVLALAPMAVKPEFQNQGIGSRLVEHGLQVCREMDYPAVVVLGHAKFYPRFGFIPSSPEGIEPPFDVPDEVFMVLELKPGGLKKVRGSVKYPPAFDQVS